MRVLACALLLLGWAGCSGRAGRNPEGAVQLLVEAARTGDRAGVYQRLGPRTRARIDALAESSRRTGGRLLTGPEDFLSVGSAPPAWEVSGVRTLRRDDATAEVEVYSAAGDRHALQLVREGQEWKVELPGQ
jgi:hypothetical protein